MEAIVPSRPSTSPFFMHWFRFMCFAAVQRDEADVLTTLSPNNPPPDALAAILFSALATEAFINELAEAASRDAKVPPGIDVPGARALADLAATLDMIEAAHGRIDLKYQLASKILTGKTLDPGAAPFQDFAALIRLRNDLVHPRQLDRATETGHIEALSKVVISLQKRGLTTTKGRKAHDPPGGISWLDEIACTRTAGWAYKAARDMITAIIEMLPEDRRFPLMVHIRGRLESMPI